MPTLISKNIFAELIAARQTLLNEFGGNVAGIFVPWVGQEFLSSGGIYYVGQATDGNFGSSEDQSFGSCLKRTTEMCSGGPHDRSQSPFWRYLDQLTVELTGERYWENMSRLGWSNILKIGLTTGSPSNWPSKLSTLQKQSSINCLREEFENLHNALVVIASANHFGILFEAMPSDIQKDTQYESEGLHWWCGQNGNVFVHGYHPNYAQRKKGLWHEQLNRTLAIARANLEWARN